jgi:AraC family transcriptional activator of tynA and feaB
MAPDVGRAFAECHFPVSGKSETAGLLPTPRVQKDPGMNQLVQAQTQEIEVWRQLVSQQFLSLHCEAQKPATFRASLRARRIAHSLVAEVSVGHCRVVRHPRDASQSEVGYFKVLWQLSGVSRIAQGAHSGVLQPGMWAVYDTRIAYSIESSEHTRFLSLLVPQDERCGWSPAVAALAGLPLDGRGTAGVVLASLTGAIEEENPLDDASADILEEALGMLMEQALAQQARSRAIPLQPNVEQRLFRIRGWIAQHVHDPSLGPQTVAQAFGISRRTLYNLFLSMNTTPRAYIQSARLALASQQLQRPELAHLSVSQVAEQSGFSSAAYFTRCFALHHGCTPAQWRRGQITG